MERAVRCDQKPARCPDRARSISPTCDSIPASFSSSSWPKTGSCGRGQHDIACSPSPLNAALLFPNPASQKPTNWRLNSPRSCCREVPGGSSLPSTLYALPPYRRRANAPSRGTASPHRPHSVIQSESAKVAAQGGSPPPHNGVQAPGGSLALASHRPTLLLQEFGRRPLSPPAISLIRQNHALVNQDIGIVRNDRQRTIDHFLRGTMLAQHREGPARSMKTWGSRGSTLWPARTRRGSPSSGLAACDSSSAFGRFAATGTSRWISRRGGRAPL